MYMYTYIHMYTYLFSCVCVYTHIYIAVYTHTHIYITVCLLFSPSLRHASSAGRGVRDLWVGLGDGEGVGDAERVTRVTF